LQQHELHQDSREVPTDGSAAEKEPHVHPFQLWK